MLKYFFILLLLLSFTSCRIIHNEKNFTLLNHTEINTKLKTDGYYYSVFDRDSIKTRNGGKGIYMFILLKDNVFHYVKNGYGDDCGKIIELDCEIKKSEEMLNSYQNFSNKRKQNKNYDIWNWGKYSTINDTIKIQWFYNKLGEYYLIEEIGVILDSTSFKIVKGIDYGRKTSQKVDKLFEFKFYPIDNLYNGIPLFDKILK